MSTDDPGASPRRRPPGEIGQVNLRIEESMRRRLEQEAKRHGVSMNREMGERLRRRLAKGRRWRAEHTAATALETA